MAKIQIIRIDFDGLFIELETLPEIAFSCRTLDEITPNLRVCPVLFEVAAVSPGRLIPEAQSFSDDTGFVIN